MGVFTFLLLAAVGLVFAPSPGRAQVYASASYSDLVGKYDATTGNAIDSSFLTSASGIDWPEGLALWGNSLFVANYSGGSVGKYDSASGAGNGNFISLSGSGPAGLAISGNTLFVAQMVAGKIGKFNASDGAGNTTFIPGLGENSCFGLAVSGETLFVGIRYGGPIKTYNATTGGLINANFVTGFSDVTYITVAGDYLYAVDYGGGKVGKYLISDPTQATYITGLNTPIAAAVSGDDLLVSFYNDPSVRKYSASDLQLINESFITIVGTHPTGLTVAAIPEPSTYAALAGLGVLGFAAYRRRQARSA